MSGILIKNGLLLTMAADGPDIAQGDILIEGSVIARVGDNLSAHGADKVIEAAGKVVMPGFVNCHNHAAMVLLRGYCDDLRLMEWLENKIWPAEDRMGGEDIYWGTMLAAAEMIKSGTTTFADMYGFMGNVAEAVRDSGIRASLCQGLVFHDGRGDKRIEYTYRLFENWRGKADGRINTMIGPHAPYTVPPDRIKQVVELAAELKSPVHIHLAETTEEVGQIFERYGKSPARYLADLGLFESCHVLLAHAVHLSEDDINLLKGMMGGVSHNPVSNQKLGCGMAPVTELRKIGVSVGLGTDGAGSASTLDMFEEIKAAAYMQKNRLFDPSVITAYDVLRMATIEGARVLGLEKEIGTIEEGKKADIIIVDMQKPHLFPHNDICALLAYSANGADIDTTIINGQIVMEHRTLLFFDEKEVMEKARNSAGRITQSQEAVISYE